MRAESFSWYRRRRGVSDDISWWRWTPQVGRWQGGGGARQNILCSFFCVFLFWLWSETCMWSWALFCHNDRRRYVCCSHEGALSNEEVPTKRVVIWTYGSKNAQTRTGPVPWGPRSSAHCTWGAGMGGGARGWAFVGSFFFSSRLRRGVVFVYARHPPSFARGEPVALVSEAPVPKYASTGKIWVSEMDTSSGWGGPQLLMCPALFRLTPFRPWLVCLLLKPSGLRAADERVCQRAHQPRQAGETQDLQDQGLEQE